MRAPPQVHARYPFGITRWDSYALAAAGAERHEEGDSEFARRLYLEALALDPHNRMALVNLGVLDIRVYTVTADVTILDRAFRRLTRAREESDSRARSSDVMTSEGVVAIHRDGLWFRATYNLTCAKVVAAEKQPEAAESLTREAQEVLAELVLQLAAVFDGADVPGRDRDTAAVYRHTMREFSNDLAPQVMVTAAGLVRTTHGRALTDALQTYFAADSPVEPAKIVKDVEMGEPNYRARYNIACYYSRLGATPSTKSGERDAAYASALRNLTLAVEVCPADLKAWARDDPALEGIRSDKATAPRFLKIVGTNGDASK
jgi:hypothetical protein